MQYIKNNSGTAAKSICAEILIEKQKVFFISRLQKVHLYKTKSSSYTFVKLVTQKIIDLSFSALRLNCTISNLTHSQLKHKLYFEIKTLSNTTGSVLGLL